MNEYKIFWLSVRDILIASLFFATAAFLDAARDVIDDKFSSSIFAKIENQDVREYMRDDWTNKYEKDEMGNLLKDDDGNLIRKYFLGIKFSIFKHPAFSGAWHLAKVIQIGMFIFAMMTLYFKQTSKIIFSFNKISHVIIAGIIFVWFALEWNIIFNLFYDIVLMV